MFSIYADGELIYYPLAESLVLIEPKLTLEVGKAGSLSFKLPPNHLYYDSLYQLKTVISVQLDNEEIWRGRVLTNNKTFDNVRSVYCEGNLSYLIDSVQKGEKFVGKAHDLFRNIITAHNARVEAAKQFTVGQLTVENRDVIIAGKSEDIQDAETGKFDYKQIALNSIADEWQNSFDYVESTILAYTGGFLRTRFQNGVTYIDLISDYGNTATQEISFGENLLDLSDADAPESIFTVLIPLGDENLTIESVNNGSDELVDETGVAKYGRIYQTHVFDNVNDANTLLENGQRYLQQHTNRPVTITVNAVDLHLVDGTIEAIHLGDKVHVNSLPHGVADLLTCTKIEYSLENPANNTYTFGTPEQTLTERYRKDIDKAVRSGGSGGGGAAEAAAEKAEEQFKEFYDEWIDITPGTGKISLGALYEKYSNYVTETTREHEQEKLILKNQVGIDIDAPNDSLNLYTLRKVIDENTGMITQQGARIDLMNDDLGSQIDLITSNVTDLKDTESKHYAELKLWADGKESLISGKADRIELSTATEELKSNFSSSLKLYTTTSDLNKNYLDKTSAAELYATQADMTSKLKLYTTTSELQNGWLSKTSAAELYATQADMTSKLKLYTTTKDLQDGYQTKTAAATMKSEMDGKVASITTNVSAIEDSVSGVKSDIKSLVDIKADLISIAGAISMSGSGGVSVTRLYGDTVSGSSGEFVDIACDGLELNGKSITAKQITSTSGTKYKVLGS